MDKQKKNLMSLYRLQEKRLIRSIMIGKKRRKLCDSRTHDYKFMMSNITGPLTNEKAEYKHCG
mgnify:CR=1 FL=1